MGKKKKLFFFLIIFFLANCSFDNKTGIWSGEKKEKIRISEIQKKQKEKENTEKIYSSEDIFFEEKNLADQIYLSKPFQNISWEMSGLNNQNNLDNLYLPSADIKFFKEKIGKNKFSLSKTNPSPLAYDNNIFLSDNRGTIFSVRMDGEINWQKNIYKKIYKKVYKHLAMSIYKDNIYVSDNIGFIYAISLKTGNVLWIKNHGIPFKSKIKIFDDKIFVVNQDNRIIAFSTQNGSVIWSIRTISSFIKSQDLLSLAISKKGFLIASNSSGDLLKIYSQNGKINWSLNTLPTSLKSETGFFKSSSIVISDESIFFSTKKSFFSYNLENGYSNWKIDVSAIGTPIISGNNIFFITENGYFVILNKNTGAILSSYYVFNVLKEKKQSTKVTGYIMGSGKIYALTMNGYLIVSSASSGKVEKFIKISDPLNNSPIIYDGKLFIYTKNSKLIGYN